jgi:hypothetical protein
MKDASTDWLECPFCGSEVTHHYSGSSDWDIECQNKDCGALVILWVRGGDEPERARERWNRRFKPDRKDYFPFTPKDRPT